MSIQISFIVPIYNTENELSRCIESILAVPIEKEIILIDDGSTDNSFLIAQKYLKQNTNIILLQQANSGVARARNHGISLARGKYLQFIDSDDYLINQHYYKSLVELADSQNVDVAKILIQINSNIPILTRLPITKAQRYAAQTNAYVCHSVDYLVEMTKNWFPSPCDGLYRTELLRCHNIFFPEGITQSEDSLFNFDVLSLPNVKVLDTKFPCYSYCYRAESVSHQKARVSHIESICRLCDMFLLRIGHFSKLQENNSEFYTRIITIAFYILLGELKNMYRGRYLSLTEQEKLKAKSYFTPKIIELMKKLELEI